MSPAYTLAAFYAGNKGSLLLWALLLSLFAVAMVLWNKNKELMPYASAVVMAIEAFFLLLLVYMANPFHELSIVPADGRGLDPLLENPAMLFHPPCLLAGYVGFSVPFAFAVAALITRRLDNGWLKSMRRWALFSWLLLGVGNLLGAWWAYMELGWGGYWGWDAVENAGLMPWLMATAFLHSSIIQERKGMLKIWNMVLIILTFELVIFGTFLTRSGVLSSVHAFNQSAMGPFFLVLIGVTLLCSLGLLISRQGLLKSERKPQSLFARENIFLLSNLILVTATLLIFEGTVFPAVSQFIYGVRIDLGTSFFNRVSSPLFLVLLLLMGVCTLIGWQHRSGRSLRRRFFSPLIMSLSLTLLLFLLGVREWYALAAFGVCAFAGCALLLGWYHSLRAYRWGGENPFKTCYRWLQWNKPGYGALIIHLSIVLIAIGVIGSSYYKMEQTVSLTPGESVSIKDYTLTYEGTSIRTTSSKLVASATLSVYHDQKLVAKLTPEKYLHRSYQHSVTETAIRSTLEEDLYVILVSWDEDGTAIFKVLVNPLVNWIWIGGATLFLGSVLVFWPDSSHSANLLTGMNDTPIEGKG